MTRVYHPRVARDYDTHLLDAVAVRRARLRETFLWGPQRRSRAVGDLVRPLTVSLVVAVLIAAGCVGWSYLQAALAQPDRKSVV